MTKSQGPMTALRREAIRLVIGPWGFVGHWGLVIGIRSISLPGPNNMEVVPVVAAAPVRKFVPQSLNPAEFEQLEPLYKQLLGRSINSVQELEQWLADASELSAAVDEYGSRRYIDKSCHTDDAA